MRTFYLQAENNTQVHHWVAAINDARIALLATSTQNSVTSPVPIPAPASTSASRPAHTASHLSSSPSRSPHGHQLTSSESDDASPGAPRSVPRSVVASSPPAAAEGPSPSKVGATKDAAKVVLSGYLMKCGSRRHNWHKRWFILSGEKLLYYRSHMVRARPAV